jgi:hypothetical protein
MEGWKILQIMKGISKLRYTVTYILYEKYITNFSKCPRQPLYSIIFTYFK